MFHTVTDASKIAFIGLQQHLQQIGCQLIDCQLNNPHLASLGAMEIVRQDFIAQLNQTEPVSTDTDCWLPQPLLLEM